MDAIKNIYRKFEEKLSATLRVILVFAVALVLIASLYSFLVGTIKSQASEKLETRINGMQYVVAEEKLFAKQEQVVEEEVDEENADEEEPSVDPQAVAMHNSISLHFTDEKANTEQFKDKERGLSSKQLEAILAFYATGNYKIGTLSRNVSRTFILPDNDQICSVGQTIPKLNKNQSDQMKSQLVAFWKRAEQGTDEKKSKFMQVRRFDLRMANIYAANDLFLCGLSKSFAELEGKNSKIRADIAQEKLVGSAMIAAASMLLDTMFKFFAAFALVVLALILYRIEKSLRK
jgi:hypothetical protein